MWWDDLRAFWGLWATEIGPRLDPGVTLDHDTAVQWKADNVDIAHVFSQLWCLTRYVEVIVDNVTPKTSVEQRVRNCARSLLLDCVKGNQIGLQYFVQGMFSCLSVRDFDYPLPLD